MAPLIESVRKRIVADGPVSFAWFMEQALYHPKHGYYSSGKVRLGRRGDYFTSVSVGPTFGNLIAAQLEEIWRRLEKPDSFTILEQGAHEGHLARDVLTALEENSPECFKRLRYLIVEPFPILWERQRQSLADFAGTVIWSQSLESIEPFVGVHFSNELLDAFPVHLVCKRRRSAPKEETRWFEKCVDWQDDEFTFVERPIANGALRQQLERLPPLPDDCEIEINLAALDWIDLLSTKLRRGYLLTIDYGYLRDDLTEPADRHGTLQSRAQHQLVNSPFDRIGECDITAHVNWTMIAARAQEKEFGIAGFTDQHHFLTGIISEHPELATGNDPSGRRQLQTLLHPEMMGRSFQILALSRGMTSGTQLSGFKFARPAHQALGVG